MEVVRPKGFQGVCVGPGRRSRRGTDDKVVPRTRRGDPIGVPTEGVEGVEGVWR